MKDKNGAEHSEQNGRFVSSGSGEKKEYSNLPSAKRLASNYENRFEKRSQNKGKTKEEFFGEEFKGVKGAAAIDKLLQEKRGHVKNAFERPEIGGIDLVWGDENGGLLHTIQKRNKLFTKGVGTISGLEMVHKIPEIVENGKFNQDDKGRLNIDYQGYRVGIMPAFYQDRVNWIVTAMEKWQ